MCIHKGVAEASTKQAHSGGEGTKEEQRKHPGKILVIVNQRKVITQPTKNELTESIAMFVVHHVIHRPPVDVLLVVAGLAPKDA